MSREVRTVVYDPDLQLEAYLSILGASLTLYGSYIPESTARGKQHNLFLAKLRRNT